jgi:hypothetical protein
MRRVGRQVRGRQGGQAQIAIGGRRLDEVGIRLTGTGLANTISHLSFPAHRHRASVEPDHLVVSTQAATVVQLFAEGALTPVGGPAVAVQIGDQQYGACLLETVEAVETGDVGRSGTEIILRFRRRGRS